MSQESRQYPCPSCHANLVFEPKDGCLTCPYCGRSEEIPTDVDGVKENSFEEYLAIANQTLSKLSDDTLQVVCSGCGAAVTFEPPVVATKCAFCGVALSVQPKSADPVVAPQGLLPFKISNQDANVLVRGWLASRWFAPSALKQFAQQEEIQGVYLPFWTYDAHTVTPYVGRRGDYYWVTESYTEQGANGVAVQRTRQVRHTRWSSAAGTIAHFFDDILVSGVTSIPKSTLRALEPWDLPALVGYDPAFLSGFRALRYQTDFKQSFPEAQAVMTAQIEDLIEADIGGDEQRIDRMRTSYSAITFKHLLLPVYVGAYRFRNCVYQVLVNARTGEVQGKRPYSAWKIISLVVVVVAVIVLLVKFGAASQAFDTF